MYQAGLVLEGGGMKGVYTAGVLDFFLDKGIEFWRIYGVSAGACHMCSYMSKQRGRALAVNTDYLGDKNYCSVYSLLKTGDIFNADMCYRQIPDELNPFDHEAFGRYLGKGYAVVTNIETGRAEYLRLRDMHKDIIAVQASASLPLVSRNVEIDGKLYLDGGISDAIPLQKSIVDGNRKNVVIMTKEEGYVRTATAPAQLAMIRAKYFKYPKVYELMRERHINYSRQLSYIQRQQENGQAFVIRPKTKSDVSRIEKDPKKLKKLYKEGYRDAAACFEELLAYLES